MHRIYVRVPDAMMAALRRELEKERKYRGTRYSMNDLCVLKLGGIGVHVERSGDVSGTLMIPRVPPPPPVPISTTTHVWPMRASEEPQPERAIRAQEPEPVEVATQIEEAMEMGELERMSDESGNDGHLDD